MRAPACLPIYEMMDRLGIEPTGGVIPRLSLSYATAFRRCSACPCKQTCREWLNAVEGSVLCPPPYCPNSDIFLELQITSPAECLGVPHVHSQISHCR